MENVLDRQENQVNRLKEAQKLKSKNLTFFKKFHPAIYNTFCEYVLDEFNVSLNTDVNQLDILYKGKSIYNDRPIAEAKESIAQFEERMAPGKPLKTIQPPFNNYMNPRFFHQRCNDIISHSPITEHNFNNYTIPDFYPVMIFNGVGSGYHVEMFLKKYDVINCAIVEPSPELFACSLYMIDWQELCQPFLNNKDRNIHFIIGPFEKEQNISSYLMMYLMKHCPLYPLTTLFINHKNLDIYKRVTEKINKDTNAFVSTWGYYDDEINQINNCLHNLKLGLPIIKKNQYQYLDLPIFIVGAGPSLDDRIELLKKYQDKVLIVSCGTAIHSLYKNGIKPDIQFELESDQVTVTSLGVIDDPEWVRSIPMMGPSQLAPRLYKLFDKKVIFFKGESVTSMLFGNEDTSVYRATPTCTNGAVGIFAHWGFKNIFLIGMDFAYRDTSKHHASGSIYYTSQDPLFVADANVDPEAKIEVKAVDGTIIRTKPLLYTAMRSTEILAKQYQEFCTFYNLSNGAAMDNTTWIEGDNMPFDLNSVDESMKVNFLKLQYDNPETFDTKAIDNKLEVLSHNMSELNNYLVEILDSIEPNLYSLTSKINEISNFLDKTLRPQVQPFYFFMRGSIWHLFYVGYSHAFAIQDEQELEQWINIWKEKTKLTMLDMKKHYVSIVFKEFDYDSDPWMTRSASDPE